MTPDQYCRNKAAVSGSDLYYGLLFLDPERRQAITAVYAFVQEVLEVVHECNDPTLGLIKLQWWRDEIARAFHGTPQHPVAMGLVAPTQAHNLPLEHFLEVIDGAEMDLDRTVYSAFRDLRLYCHRLGGVPALMTAEILGYQQRATLDYAIELGIASGLTDIIRNLGQDAREGRIYLPLDEMSKFGVTPEALRSLVRSRSISDLLRYQVERARSHYRRAMEKLPEIDRYAQRVGLILAALAQTTLSEIERDEFRVLQHRLVLPPLRKLVIAWNIFRREKRRHKRVSTGT